MKRFCWWKKSTATRPSWQHPLLLGAALCSTVLPLLAPGCSSDRSTVVKSENRTWLETLTNRNQSNKVQVPEPEIEAAKKPVNLAKVHLEYALVTEQEGHPQEAHKHYLTALKADPKNLSAITGLARVELALGDDEGAEALYLKATKLEAQSPAAYHELGQFYAGQKRWAEAIEPLNKALLAAPEVPQYRFDLAVALAHRGQIETAMPHFIRTVGDAEAHYNVALILNEAHDRDGAIRELERAVAKKPNLKQARYWLRQIQANESATEVVSADHAAPVAEKGEIRPAGFQDSEETRPSMHPKKLKDQPAEANSEQAETKQQAVLLRQQSEQRRNQSAIDTE